MLSKLSVLEKKITQYQTQKPIRVDYQKKNNEYKSEF